MPTRSSAVAAATAVFLVGLAILLYGVTRLSSHRGSSFALMGAGFAVIMLSSWVSARRKGAAEPEPGASGQSRRPKGG